jgi:mitogen-activated protein kinase organizer 1
VTSARFSNDGNCILASTLDGTVRLFDKESGELLNQYALHDVLITCSFTGHLNKTYKLENCMPPNDAFIYSGSEDGRILCWDLVEVPFD